MKTARILALFLALSLLLSALGFAAAEAEDPVVKISVKDAGDIYVELYPDVAPITVANFLKLVDSGFYDGLKFHRIIRGFMIQGGDPKGNGTGGSAETIKGEFSANGVENPLAHTRGVISMARSSAMDSASSQFFIVHADSPHLNGNYAAFGKVLAGMGTVDRLVSITQVTDNNGTVPDPCKPVITAVVRIDRAEAEAAMAAEAANGKSGTLFRAPTGNVSFPVPEGWNLIASLNGISEFTSADGGVISIAVTDMYAYYTEAVMTANGITRAAFDNSMLREDAIAQNLGVSVDAVTEKTFPCGAFRMANDPRLDGNVHVLGAVNGVVVEMAQNSPMDSAEALFAILNAMTVE